jgi:oxygen-independent coproporphyrinogen-3 oxidase
MTPTLLARYANQRVPRYTSYPTAPHFRPEVGRVEYGDWLADLPEGTAASLYLHVPFCRSMCWYCGCHTTVARRDGPILDYVRSLRQEVDLVAGRLRGSVPVRHIHFGGGTPTILPPAVFLALVDLLRDKFAISENAEIGIEIDPRTLTGEMTTALGAGGVTRASLGVQCFDPMVQSAINRVQSFEQTAAVVQGLRQAGIRGINLDLIYGLPHQTVSSSIETVAQCLTLRPDRLSVFGYAHLPSFKKHQRKINEVILPQAGARHAQAEAIEALLVDAGYRRIGLDHYARHDDSMALALDRGMLHRNFQGYTTDGCEALLGFGASAIGRLTQGYVQNEVVIGRYAERIARGELPIARGHALTQEDRLRADLIERLMCDFRVDVTRVCRQHEQPAPCLDTAFPALAALERDGLIQVDGSVIEVAPAARSLVRAVAAAFDAYLGTIGIHSRSV